MGVKGNAVFSNSDCLDRHVLIGKLSLQTKYNGSAVPCTPSLSAGNPADSLLAISLAVTHGTLTAVHILPVWLQDGHCQQTICAFPSQAVKPVLKN